MRDPFPPEVEAARVLNGRYGSKPGSPEGAFLLVLEKGARSYHKVIASTGLGWDHVSVSTTRLPTWGEMCRIKDLFFEPEECVVQYHPPESEYVRNHPHVLHLWRWQGGPFPMPPRACV